MGPGLVSILFLGEYFFGVLGAVPALTNELFAGLILALLWLPFFVAVGLLVWSYPRQTAQPVGIGMGVGLGLYVVTSGMIKYGIGFLAGLLQGGDGSMLLWLVINTSPGLAVGPIGISVMIACGILWLKGPVRRT